MNQTPRHELDVFTAAVLSRLGFRLDEHNADQMEQVVRQRLERTGCKTVEDYVERFKDPGFAKEEMREVALNVTVPETYFFRHPEQFRALAEVALPARLKARGTQRQLNVLSAGCASGEEAYTIAATLLKVSAIQGWDLRIWGIDVNVHLLQKARQARYSEWALRALDEAQRSRLFARECSDYLLNGRIKSMVRFEERNLLVDDESFWREDFFDIIFCRNVMIYFSPAAVRFLAARITRSLAPGGFLFLGPSETLRGISQEFHLRHTHEAFYYQRRLPGEPSTLAIPVRAMREPTAAGSFAPPEAGSNWVSTIAGASERITALANRSRETSPEMARALEPAPQPLLPARQNMEEVHNLLREERFADALRAMDALPGKIAADPDKLLLQAVLLANSGGLAQAEQLCEQLLQKDELRPGAHYLMAVCHEKRGDHLSAAEHDQMAIYLDPKFAMPRLHLGLLARRLGDMRTARRELADALSLLGREDSSRILLFGGGFSREALIQFCRAQLELCGGGQ